MYKIYTYATHDTGYFNKLINNKFGAKVNVIGFGEKWKGFIHKLKRLLKEIKKEDPDTVIFIVDGFDTIINKDPIIAYTYYVNNFSKPVMTYDINTDNPILKFFMNRVFLHERPLNSGLMVGRSKDLIKIMEKIYKYNEVDDQRFYNKCRLDFEIDEKNIIFKHLNFHERKNIYLENSVFLQVPGNITIERFKRGISEYSRFFVPEIILIIVLIIIGIYLYRKIS